MTASEPQPEATPAPTTRLQKWLLAALLLWALAARVLFSWPDPTMNRLWDERYNAGNVATALAFDQWRPLRTHYPTLSYMPHTVVLKLYEEARALPLLEDAPTTFGIARDGRAHLTPIAVRVCRILQTLVGTASLFVVFLIGRRLFGPWVGLGAAFLLAVAPWHLRQSGVFKPDIMLVLAAVLALYAMLRARRAPSAGSYAVAGALVGATAAAKWNGAALALPLLAALVLGGVSSPGLLLRRAAAAAAAGAATLLALNPWLVLAPDLYRRHLGNTVSHYRERLAEVGASLFDQPLSAVTSLAGGVYFGPVLGAAALLGLAWMLALALRAGRGVASALPGTGRGAAGEPRGASGGAAGALPDAGRGIAGGGATVADAWILLVFFGGYVASLWVVTRYPKPPNWLIVAPVVALAGAWCIGRLLQAARTLPRGPIQATAVAVLALAAGAAGLDKARFVHATVYDTNVPLTSAAAARAAGSPKPLRGRTMFSELPLGKQDIDPRTWDGAFVPTLIQTEDLAAEASAERDAADVLLFGGARLAPGEDPVYRELAAPDGGVEVRRFDPRPFRLRGDSVVLVRRPFLALGGPEAAPFAAAGDGVHEVEPAALEAGDGDPGPGRLLVSLEVAVRVPAAAAADVAVEVDGVRLPCRHTQKGRARRRCLTPRFEAPESPVRILVEPPRDVIDVTVFHWRRPG